MNFLNKTRRKRLLQAAVFAALLLHGADVYAQFLRGKYPQEKLIDRIERIKKETDKNIVCDVSQLKDTKAPEVEANGISVEEALRLSVAGTNFLVEKVGLSFTIRPRTKEELAQEQRKGRGKLTGTVLDKDGFPIPGASVVVAGTSNGVATDLKGNFTLNDVPTRTFSVEVSCISYAKMRISDITVRAGQTKPLDVVLQDDTEQLQEVVVTASYNKASANGLYAKQKAMVAMSDGVSADLIKKTSDNNVAQVLKRVAGVTIDNGKYVTVRGMGERYNNVQLNGATLPSTEPNRRNFSFDVIPTGLIDNVTIAKTFTPDLPGEFTGGLVEVQTLAVPEKKFVNVSVGTGMNTISTGKDFLSNQRFGSDWFLGEIDDRKWYAGQDEEVTKQSMVNAGNKNTWGLRKFKGMPVQNYSLTVGAPFAFGNDQKIGVVAALTYRNEQTREEIEEAHFLSLDTIFKPGNTYKFATSVGAVANVGWEMPGHKITWRNLFNNRFTHTNRERYINSEYEHYKAVEQYSAPLISRVMQTQLDGEHHIFDDRLIFTWNGSYNKSKRTSPDDRYATGYVVGKDDDNPQKIDWLLSTMYGGGKLRESHTMYGNLDENKKNIAADLAYPFIVANNKQQIKMGYMGNFRHAEYEQIYLKPQGGNLNIPFYGTPINEFFAPEHFNDGTLEYIVGRSLSEADYYKGDQTIHAGYLMGEFTFLRKLHFTGGVRMEKGNTEVNTKYWEPSAKNGAGAYVDTLQAVKKTDWLPAGTLVYNITDNINVRAAYSKTIARPDFRELTPVVYFNVDDRITVKNEKRIEQSYSNNYDVRLEWYPQAGEVVSVSAFYKKFKKPVELVTYALSQTEMMQFSFNLDDASVKGIELNVRKSLGFIAPAPFLQNLYVSANATFIKGDVTYNLDELMGSSEVQKDTRKRPLQGLSPYTVNAGLTYQGKILGAALNYGRNGRKLVMAGEQAQFDQFEASRNVLDLQISARFLKERLEIKFNASDLLNEDIIVYRNCKYVENKGYIDLTSDMNYNTGDWVMSRINKGVNLSLSVGYKF